MKSWDSVWEEVFKNSDWGKYPSESLIRFIFKNFPSKNELVKVLEVGCGTGANIWFLSREGFKTFGIDGSPTAILKANKRISDDNLKAELTTGDIIKLPYENDFFDAVIDSESLYSNTFTNTFLILQEIKRVLKKDGLFYSKTFSDKIFSSEKKEFEVSEYPPFKNKGFVRLTSFEEIHNLYGKIFNLISIDHEEQSRENNSYKISEWIIISKK